MKFATVILAAGLGTRMKSQTAKVLHAVLGRPMIAYPVALARALGAERVVCVLGHQADAVRADVEQRFGRGAIEVALQKEQRGTGHAVAQAAPLLRSFSGKVLLLYGDVPLLTESVLRRLLDESLGVMLGLVTARLPNPHGYGRIVRNGKGRLQRIVEEKDAGAKERAIDEVNAGIYCVDARFLFGALERLRDSNAQRELYLTDVAEQAAQEGNVVTVQAPADEVMGVNDRVDLARADRILRLRNAEKWMRAGVTLRDPESVRIEADVEIGSDSEIGALVELRGKTRIGRGVTIDQGCVLSDATIADGVHVKPYTVISESRVAEAAQLGPFSHLRPGSDIGADAKIGNFVETKKARFGRNAKASHLSYLGDADIGDDVNIGCGTITCNYDGHNKFKTTIGRGAFIGSDTQLVAPVAVGENAIIGAGTTVVEDVPAGALALSRAKQIAVAGYAERKRREREAAAGRANPKKRAAKRSSARKKRK